MSVADPVLSTTGFYEPGALRHVAINLFYGWGYNFYRKENQLRAARRGVRARRREPQRLLVEQHAPGDIIHPQAGMEKLFD